MKTLLLFLVVLGMATCTKPVSNGKDGSYTIYFGDKLPVHEGIITQIEYLKLRSESRCPPNADCIWQGNAFVDLRINNTDVITLGIGDLSKANTGAYQNSADYRGTTITLVELNYDPSKDFGVESKSSVKLALSK